MLGSDTDATRRPRAEREHVHGTHRRVVPSKSLRVHRCGSGISMGVCARRRQRGCAAHAGRDWIGGEYTRVRGEGKGQDGLLPADGLWAPAVQNHGPPRESDERHVPQAAQSSENQRPAAEPGHGAGTRRAVGRVLHQTQTVPQRRLLLGDMLSRSGHSREHVYSGVRGGEVHRLDFTVERDGGRVGGADFSASANVRGGDGAALRTSGGARRRQR
mmetsp:Transcript_31932/g.51132  ORF Transcript_31932/g.51132 Transcript_31932/m.51132 type:complete len:216 (-) Transcript_31932:537-1184(-)